MTAVVRLSPGVAFGFAASVVGPYLSINTLIGLSVWVGVMALFAFAEGRLVLVRDASATTRLSVGELYVVGGLVGAFVQIEGDYLVPHLGDVLVFFGVATPITWVLRNSSFASARARYRSRWRRGRRRRTALRD